MCPSHSEEVADLDKMPLGSSSFGHLPCLRSSRGRIGPHGLWSGGPLGASGMRVDGMCDLCICVEFEEPFCYGWGYGSLFLFFFCFKPAEV